MKTVRVLLTSVGVDTGPNVISAFRQAKAFKVKLIGVDRDPLAAGLYLCDKHYLMPSIDSPIYIQKLLKISKKEAVQVWIPLLSKEMKIAAQNKSQFEAIGVRVAVSPLPTIELCENKRVFIEHLHNYKIPAPKQFETSKLKEGDFPVFVKPLKGSSSRNCGIAYDRHEVGFYARRAGQLVIQEYLQGQEYTIDVLCDWHCNLVAGVIRERLSVKDGKSVKGKTIKNERVMAQLRRLLKVVKIIGQANIQCIVSRGVPKFFEVNTRFAAGGLPLTVKAGVNLPELLIKIIFDDKIRRAEINYREGIYMSRYLTEVFPKL